MVRFKNRYFVIEVETPNGVFNQTASETDLLTVKTVNKDIKSSIKENLGEMALAKLVTSLRVMLIQNR
jgi:hypothetical protein